MIRARPTPVARRNGVVDGLRLIMNRERRSRQRSPTTTEVAMTEPTRRPARHVGGGRARRLIGSPPADAARPSELPEEESPDDDEEDQSLITPDASPGERSIQTGRTHGLA
jgi:hypothetical protein